jgi:ribose-phosphate pyrophosphokinase
MKTKSLGIQGRNVIIFDDIISSGGTIVTVAKMLKQLNPKGIYVACVHPLLIGEAEKNILQAGVQEIVGTDSVPSKVSRVSLAGLISRELAT